MADEVILLYVFCGCIAVMLGVALYELKKIAKRYDNMEERLRELKHKFNYKTWRK